MSDLEQDNKNFVLYTDESGNIRVEAYIKDETIWLTQKNTNDFTLKIKL